MSAMSNLMIDIQTELETGELSIQDIATKYHVPVSWVHEALDEMIAQEVEDGMDGDFDSAMASAGFGMDEDYGYASDTF